MAYLDKLAGFRRAADQARAPALVRPRRQRRATRSSPSSPRSSCSFISGNLGQGFVKDVLGWVVVVLVVGGLGYLAWQVAALDRTSEFVVTTRRVLQMEGVINKRVIDSSLEKINDAILTESLFGRMFGFGDLEILTASESGISRLRMLRDADDFKRAMLEAKHELELELSGGRADARAAAASRPPDQPAAPPAGRARRTAAVHVTGPGRCRRRERRASRRRARAQPDDAPTR